MAERVVVTGGTVIDGTGAEPLVDGVVVVESGRVTQVGRASDFGGNLPSGNDVQTVDASGKHVIPGMINMHEHLDTHRGVDSFQVRAAQPTERLILRSSRNALISLMMGVTTVRDVGSKGATNLIMRDAINAGYFLGPRVYAVGEPIAMTGGHGYQICVEADGVDNVRLAARHQLKQGADVVKVMASGGHVETSKDQPWSPQLTPKEVAAAFEEARWAGKTTCAHAHPPAAIKMVVEAGVTTVEHGGLMDAESAELMEKHGVYLVPTLDESFMIAEFGHELGRPQWLIDHSKARLDGRLDIFRHAVKGGVKLCVGTDVAGEMGREMSHMIDGGISNADALVAATKNGAKALQLDDQLGTLEAGKLADLVVLDENPLDNILACDRPSLVMKGGEVYDPAALRVALGPVAD